MRPRLERGERGLDALIGLVIMTAALMIGALTISVLYEAGLAETDAARLDAMQVGFAVALFLGGGVMIVALLVYLVRIAIGRRSWTAALWGGVLMSAALVVGSLIMFA